MKNYYAVRVGYNTGVYEDLNTARNQIRGYSGGQMKGFNMRDDALDYLYENTDKTKYYVHEDMIFSDLDECKKYCSSWYEFYDLEEARDFVCEDYHDGYDERLREDLCYTDHEGDRIYEVYTDGACSRNGQPDAKAGVGVYFGANNSDNISSSLGGSPQTNQRAELVAIKHALLTIERFDDEEYYQICTDSSYAINCLTVWYKKWQKNGWVNMRGEEVANKKLIQEILELMSRDSTSGLIGFRKVDAHSNCEGNNKADELAREGCYK